MVIVLAVLAGIGMGWIANDFLQVRSLVNSLKSLRYDGFRPEAPPPKPHYVPPAPHTQIRED